MKKKFLAALILICFFSTSIFAAGTTSSTSTTPEPYTDDEFPDWAKYIRRFEIVTLGSLPFTTMTVTTIYTSIRYVQNGFDSNYIPNPFAFTSSEANIDQDEQKLVLYSAIATSLVLGIIDISIYVAKKEKAKKANKQVLPNFVQVQHLDEEGNLVNDSETEEQAEQNKKQKKNAKKLKNKKSKKTVEETLEQEVDSENTSEGTSVNVEENESTTDGDEITAGETEITADEKQTDTLVEDESEVEILIE
ncbi:MAG: hypothetical protein K6G52_01995 [Treponemataceae bacterium]|nr:hypothetical protein [Treponemataceae bacterium]